jgi:hypothetical protein
MKKLAALTLMSFSIGLSARAQWVVYDPTVHAQQIIGTAEELAKYAVMINNQVQQIQTLSSQLAEFKNYEALFGNPASVSLSTAQSLVTDLGRMEVGVTLPALQTTANANQAMAYDGGGLFQAVGTTFATPKGQTVTRQQAPYVPIAAIQNTTSNYLSVSTNIEARRVALKQDIAATIDQLKAATTAADVQKLTGVLVGLSSALNNSDYELGQASSSVAVQDIANRNDAQRQDQAQKEQQQAEFTEAVQQYGKTFKLLNTPTQFPTQQ